jgi:hypothetical protein
MLYREPLGCACPKVIMDSGVEIAIVNDKRTALTSLRFKFKIHVPKFIVIFDKARRPHHGKSEVTKSRRNLIS